MAIFLIEEAERVKHRLPRINASPSVFLLLCFLPNLIFLSARAPHSLALSMIAAPSQISGLRQREFNSPRHTQKKNTRTHRCDNFSANWVALFAHSTWALLSTWNREMFCERCARGAPKTSCSPERNYLATIFSNLDKSVGTHTQGNQLRCDFLFFNLVHVDFIEECLVLRFSPRLCFPVL